MRHHITTVRDIRNWAAEHAGDNMSADDIEAIADAIRSRDDCPAWGEDWTDYLDSLPAPWTLIPDNRETVEPGDARYYRPPGAKDN